MAEIQMDSVCNSVKLVTTYLTIGQLKKYIYILIFTTPRGEMPK